MYPGCVYFLFGSACGTGEGFAGGGFAAAAVAAVAAAAAAAAEDFPADKALEAAAEAAATIAAACAGDFPAVAEEAAAEAMANAVVALTTLGAAGGGKMKERLTLKNVRSASTSTFHHLLLYLSGNFTT